MASCYRIIDITVHQYKVFELPSSLSGSPLSLLMTWVSADDADTAPSPNNAAIATDLFY